MDDSTALLYTLCHNGITGKTTAVETVTALSHLLAEQKELNGDLLDVLSIIDQEVHGKDGGEKKNFVNLVGKIANEILPEDVLRIELNCYGADEKATTSRVVKTKTRIYYKQLKFNLLREESEGYSKLISELLAIENDASLASVLGRIRSLIGQFNLDPNRTIDMILDCFEHSLARRQLFVDIIREFKIDRDDLLAIVCQKFVLIQKNEPVNTPFSLYQLAAVLCIEDLVDMHAVFAILLPSQEDLVADHKYYTELCKKRSRKAEMISTASLDIDKSSLRENTPLDDTNVTLSTSVPFSIATQSQANEDKQLCGSDFDDNVTLSKNQKLGLICALLEYGDWNRAKQLLDRLPEFYGISVSNRIASALANIVGYIVEQFYHQKVQQEELFGSDLRDHAASSKFQEDLLEQISSWDDIPSFLYPVLYYLGPYIASQMTVAVKLLRLLTRFFDEERSQSTKNSNVTNTIMDICDYVLVPAMSLIDYNYSYSEELWALLSNFSYIDRYRLYGRWKNTHTPRHWELMVQKGKIIGKTRYVMKRLTKETVKLMGRQLGKLCHVHPAIVFDYLLTQIQTFQNFIGPVVDAMRFSSSLEFDVLSFCLIESLASPEKQTLKTETGMISPWLLALSNFIGALYRRYNIELDGMLFYVVNQLKDGKSFDLLILREIIQNMSGVDTNLGLTEDQLEAMAGSEFLKQEIGSYSLNKASKRSTTRLKDSLFKPDMIESLCTLIAQQRNSIIFVESQEIPLKLSGQMLDQCQDTLVQFMNFLRANMRPEDYARRMPPISELIKDRFLTTDCAMYFARPIYMHRIQQAYDVAKRALKEGKTNNDKSAEDAPTQNGEKTEKSNDKSEKDKEKSKLEPMIKTSLFITAFDEVVNTLEDELRLAFSEAFWNELTSRLFSVFWLLSISDLYVPQALYEQKLQKCKDELKTLDIEAKAMSKKSAAKEEERLKGLELKLGDELRRQQDHVRRVKDVLASEMFKEQFFAQNQRIQIIRFLQSCILPRAIFTDSDAQFCARFIELLHSQKTDFFQTLILIDKIFNDITPLVAGLTENETSCFGRFCNMILDMIHRWHSSKSVFSKECESFPGCVTKVKKVDTVKETNITYDSYRTMCFKWQYRILASLNSNLLTKNYILIRNSLILLTKILPNFPMTIQHYNLVEKAISNIRDQEKGTRDDLSLLAASYLGQLKKRPRAPIKQEDYYPRPAARPTLASKPAPAPKADISKSSLLTSTKSARISAPIHESKPPEKKREEKPTSNGILSKNSDVEKKPEKSDKPTEREKDSKERLTTPTPSKATSLKTDTHDEKHEKSSKDRLRSPSHSEASSPAPKRQKIEMRPAEREKRQPERESSPVDSRDSKDRSKPSTPVVRQTSSSRKDQHDRTERVSDDKSDRSERRTSKDRTKSPLSIGKTEKLSSVAKKDSNEKRTKDSSSKRHSNEKTHVERSSRDRDSRETRSRRK